MNRREFLLLSADSDKRATLSCEQLYMRYVDSTFDGTTAQFLTNLEQRLSTVSHLLLNDATWLTADELQPINVVLDAFRARGGQVEYRNQLAED